MAHLHNGSSYPIPFFLGTSFTIYTKEVSLKESILVFNKIASLMIMFYFVGVCKRCGYISSQPLCKACVLLEGLNKGLPR